MKKTAPLVASLVTGCALALIEPVIGDDISFSHRQLTAAYHGEGAALGDLNQDQHIDLISGPFWYEGPNFEIRHEYYLPNPKDPNQNGYTNDNFLEFVADFNHDGWNDIFVVAFPGTAGHWFANPQGKGGHWNKHLALKGLGNESPTLQDLNKDGVPEVFCVSQGAFGFAQIDSDAPTQPWTFHPVSPNEKRSPFTHGLGVGDLDGDGRIDILTKDGWYTQPKSLTDSPHWQFNAYSFRPSRRLPFPGGAQIYAYDVDGDDDNDIIMSLAAHGYGLAWFEQDQEAGQRVFRQHTLLRQDGKPEGTLPPFSQLHAMELADIDGDGLKDIIVGKCRYAHGPAGDPDPQGDPVLYWFQLSRTDGKTHFTPHLIGRTAGVGRQIAIGDINQNGNLDIAIGNKSGTHLYTR